MWAKQEILGLFSFLLKAPLVQRYAIWFDHQNHSPLARLWCFIIRHHIQFWLFLYPFRFEANLEIISLCQHWLVVAALKNWVVNLLVAFSKSSWAFENGFWKDCIVIRLHYFISFINFLDFDWLPIKYKTSNLHNIRV